MTKSAVVFVQRWWPVAAMLTVSITLQKALVEARYDVSGHAGEHLASASALFPALACVGALLYATPPARKQPLVLVTAAMWLASTALVLVGNLRVVDALVGAGMADTPTSQLVGTATIDSAHDLANLAPWLGVVTSLALIGALRWRRHISDRVTIGAIVLSIIFPPWMIPGAGVLVVTIARCVAFHRAARTRSLPSLPAGALIS